MKPMFRYRNLIRSPCFQHFRSRLVVGCWEMVLVWGVAAYSWRWGRGTRARSGLFWRLTAFANNHFCVEKQDTGGVSSPARKHPRAGTKRPTFEEALWAVVEVGLVGIQPLPGHAASAPRKTPNLPPRWSLMTTVWTRMTAPWRLPGCPGVRWWTRLRGWGLPRQRLGPGLWG